MGRRCLLPIRALLMFRQRQSNLMQGGDVSMRRPNPNLTSRAHAVTRAAPCGGPAESAPVLPPSVTEIISPTNPYVKHCVKLRTSARYRQETGRCLLVGRGLLEEAVGEEGGSCRRGTAVGGSL